MWPNPEPIGLDSGAMWRPVSRRPGQGMIEYALILTITSMVIIVILLTMGKDIKHFFSNVVCSLDGRSACVIQPSPTSCPLLFAPTLTPEQTSTPVYTFTAADFGSHKQVLRGSVVRVLLPCMASYRSGSSTALIPILWGNGYIVLVASSPGTSQLTGSLDHSNSALWHIDVTVVD